MSTRRQSFAPSLRTGLRSSWSAASMRASSALPLGGRWPSPKRAAAPRVLRNQRASDSPRAARLPAASGRRAREASTSLAAKRGCARLSAPTTMRTPLTASGTSVRAVHSSRRPTMASAVASSACRAARKSAVDRTRGPARSRAAMASSLDGFGTDCTYSRKRSRRAWQRSGSVEVHIFSSPGSAAGAGVAAECTGMASSRAPGSRSGRSQTERSFVGTCMKRCAKKTAVKSVFMGSVALIPGSAK
mmetsp:Transcript_52906/g.153973  ORF Transcript_52906/g.153973 Transcript_52906/m.153973 type:complete len:246 (-) Transcript_52906:1284-2021(-)